MGQLSCYRCQNIIEFVDKLPLREECSACRYDAHVCRNCEFYDSKVYHECLEPQAEYTSDKEKANRCDYFRPKAKMNSQTINQKENLLNAAEALFKKKL